MINRVVLVGRLTRDPDLRYTNSVLQWPVSLLPSIETSLTNKVIVKQISSIV